MIKDISLLMKATEAYSFFSTMPNATNKCLDIKGGADAACAPLILYRSKKQDNQIFHICPVSDGYCAIVAAHSLMVLDVAKANAADGTSIIIYECHNSPNQKFKLEKA